MLYLFLSILSQSTGRDRSGLLELLFQSVLLQYILVLCSLLKIKRLAAINKIIYKHFAILGHI